MPNSVEPDDARVAAMLARFAAVFGRPATALVRAPGRVNLLGEHTDYNGLPVLPMAIDHSVLVAAAPADDATIRLHNLDPAYSPRQYELADSLRPFEGGDWGNYHKAAVQGLRRSARGALRRGGDFLLEGNIPAGAGLSSSSAVVVASALAVLAVNEITMPFPELAELLPQAERYVGTLSGGMDQAISLLAVAGHALRIDFFPLRVRPVRLPPGYRFVVCHSLVSAEKSGGARRAYNLRVVECRLGARVCEVALRPALPRALNTLGDLARLFPSRSLPEFLPALEAYLPRRQLTLSEVAHIIGSSPEQLREDCRITADLGDQFAVLARLRHVLSEADRVERAEPLLAAADAAGFGALMDASHASCRDDYEISCPAVEELVAVAKESGALGARVTGAGFGGCVVALVEAEAAGGFLELVDRRFYRPRLGHKHRPAAQRFVYHACPGAWCRRL
ncbi:MAG: galactokinase [Deltaproteobacteria bacterium]|nr:galactokinase [Deltaproteobacteria bacterium]